MPGFGATPRGALGQREGPGANRVNRCAGGRELWEGPTSLGSASGG